MLPSDLFERNGNERQTIDGRGGLEPFERKEIVSESIKVGYRKRTDAATERRKQMHKNIDHLQEHGHKRRTIMSGERATRSVREGASPSLLSSHYQHNVFRLTGLGIGGGGVALNPASFESNGP